MLNLSLSLRNKLKAGMALTAHVYYVGLSYHNLEFCNIPNPQFRILNFSDFYYTTFLTLFCNFIPCILYFIYLIMCIYLLDVLSLAVGLD